MSMNIKTPAPKMGFNITITNPTTGEQQHIELKTGKTAKQLKRKTK